MKNLSKLLTSVQQGKAITPGFLAKLLEDQSIPELIKKRIIMYSRTDKRLSITKFEQSISKTLANQRGSGNNNNNNNNNNNSNATINNSIYARNPMWWYDNRDNKWWFDDRNQLIQLTNENIGAFQRIRRNIQKLFIDNIVCDVYIPSFYLGTQYLEVTAIEHPQSNIRNRTRNYRFPLELYSIFYNNTTLYVIHKDRQKRREEDSEGPSSQVLFNDGGFVG